jgi:hypothetical protein
MLEQPKLGFLAVNQLAAWEALAEGWPVTADERGVGRCGQCGHGVLLQLDRNQVPYRYTHEQWLALVVLHLRNHHADLDPDKG